MTYTKKENPNDIMLGDGATCFIDNVCVGMTRGGAAFKTNSAIKHIDADGDKGDGKGRHRKTECKPTIELNLLQLISENVKNFYSGIKVEDAETGVSKITGRSINDTDYHEVAIVGKTKDGRDVVIKLFDAINLEGLDWSTADKDEVVAKVTFTGTYDSQKLADNNEYEPYEITFVKPTIVEKEIKSIGGKV